MNDEQLGMGHFASLEQWQKERITRLEAENERLKEEIEALTHSGRQGELEQANVVFAAQNQRYREALWFYATESNWTYNKGTLDAYMHAYDQCAPILRDGGQIAINALKESE